MEILQQPNFNLLRKDPVATGVLNYGGEMRLPEDFDSRAHAAHWAKDGHEVLSRQRDQVLIGTEYTAPGWNVWTYPKETLLPDPTGKLTMQPHPEAGKRHTVAIPSGGVYVLMFRSRAVQAQVDELYALHSRKLMGEELEGERVTVDNRQGLLTNHDLTQAGDHDPEAGFHPPSEPIDVATDGTRIEPKKIKLSR